LERIQERTFRFLLNDYDSDYDQLLAKLNKPTLEIRRLRLLATEIFKTINNLNAPGSDKLLVQSQNSMKYGSYTLRSLGPKIWNKLPTNIKNAQNLLTFKEMINTWSGPKCHCSSCKYLGICS